MIPERLQSLIAKLQAMADRGTTHERINAASKLADIAIKYNINIDDFSANKPIWREYDVMLKHQRLFWQLVFLTCPDYDGRYRHITNERRKFKICLTEAEHLQVTFLFDYYVRDYDKQLKLFTRAYFIRNKLLLPATSEDAKPLTEDDIAAIEMSFGIKRIDKPMKQLSQ